MHPTGLASLLLSTTLAGCSTSGALTDALNTAQRQETATAARFTMRVIVEATPAEGPLHFTPLQGQVELVFTNRSSKAVGRALLQKSSLHGALAVGDYALSLQVDGMRFGLEARIGLVPLAEGDQALGLLRVRLVELPPGSFEEQAAGAEQVRRAHALEAVDFVHSPARGLLLYEVVLEPPAP